MIARSAALGLRLLRLGGPRAWASAALVGVGVTVGTALLAVVLGALHGWDAREARMGWRIDDAMAMPAATTVAEPVALVRTQTDTVDGHRFTVTDLALLRADTPLPPGFDRVPAPGEVWVTPAFERLLAELPADRLADRFPGPPRGVIAPAGLAEPGELAVVIGRDPETLRVDAGPDPVPVTRFDQAAAEIGVFDLYRQLTVVAVILVVFPVVSLLGASARLSTATRSQRLATLRLLGASTPQVTTVAVAEVTAIAALAALAGLALQWVLAPALVLIPLGGYEWYAADLRPSPLVGVGVAAGVVVLATLAALDGMRQVVISPLGVARRTRPRGVRLLRLVGAAAGIAVFVAISSVMRLGPVQVMGLVFGVGVLALFTVISLVGPLVVRLLASRMVRRARTPATLVAGRRLLDDPKGAFRPLAGVVLAMFVASFLAPLLGATAAAVDGDDRTVRITAPDRDEAALATQAREQLARLGIDAAVEPIGTSRIAVVPAPGEDLDRVRTALAPLVPGRVIRTQHEAQAFDLVVISDLTRGAIIVLVCAFVVAATATGAAAAARVLDHAHTLRLLHLAGVPVSVLDRARRAETTRPLGVNGVIAVGLGLLCASPFAAATEALAPDGLLLLAGSLTGGALLVVAASAASRPLLRSVVTLSPRRVASERHEL